ncbi:MAG: O-antigen ligase family protein [Herbiconiux sp.]|nr:O-antigen ligase family protein [Herbiconiux sp.]
MAPVKSSGAATVIATIVGAIGFIVVVLMVGIEYSLIGIVVLIATFLLLRFPVAAVYVLVVLLPFNGLITQVTNGSAVFGLYGAAKDFILFGMLIIAMISGRVRRVPTTIVALVLATVILATASALFTPDLVQASYGWRNDYEPLLLLIAIPALVEFKSVRSILATVIVVGQISAAIAVLTWTRGLQWLYDIGRLPVASPDDFPTALFSSGNQWPRAFSPYVAPNEMAVVMSVLLAIVWLLPKVRVPARLALSALPITAIVLSGSRSALLGAIVVGCVLAARAIHWRSTLLSVSFLIMAGFGVIFGAALYITNQLGDGGDPSVGGHSASLEEGLRIMAQNPLGVGLGRVGPRARALESSYHVESFWLLIGIESGILVLALFVILMGYLARRAVLAKTNLGFLGAAALAASLVSQLVLPTLQEGAVSFLLWTVVGLSIVALRHEKELAVGVPIEGLDHLGHRDVETTNDRYRRS